MKRDLQSGEIAGELISTIESSSGVLPTPFLGFTFFFFGSELLKGLAGEVLLALLLLSLLVREWIGNLARGEGV